jgi:hypothetical protein
MTFECPSCRSCLRPQEIKNEWGNGIHCPVCGAEVRYSPAYQHIILIGSSPFLVAALSIRGIEQGFVASIMMVLAWFVGSILLSVLVCNILPPKLKLASDDEEDPYSPPSILK